MKAWQAQIKDRRAEEEAEANLFGAWWDDLDLSLAKAVVQPIDSASAKTIVEKYEWLGTMPAVIRYCFGIYFDGACGGVVVYSDDYAENLGVWDSYGYTGKIILLARGCSTHWAPVNTASKLIRRSMKLLPERYEVVTATVDAQAGEIGTIYQACGFDYVGVMTEGGKRANLTRNGSNVSGRQARRLHATEGIGQLTALGVAVEGVPRKGRYFGFRGRPHRQRELRQAIAHKIQPYPSRTCPHP